MFITQPPAGGDPTVSAPSAQTVRPAGTSSLPALADDGGAWASDACTELPADSLSGSAASVIPRQAIDYGAPVTDDRLRRFEERGLTRELGFGQRPAVLAVDLIKAFTDPRLPFGADLDGVVEQARRVLDQGRRTSIPVLFTTVGYEDDLADAGLWAVKVPASATLRLGSPDVELDGRLGRTGGESVLVKKYASAFFGTDLVSRLNALRVDTLVIVGCTTSGCVRATAVDAIQNGFRPMVVREAVGDRDTAAHEQSLLDLQAKYADVVTVDSVLAHLASVPSAVPVP